MSTDHDARAATCTAGPAGQPVRGAAGRHGMLLGEDDFRTLMGNPRGKQMLHWPGCTARAWSGASPSPRGKLELRVGPGLAIDGLGPGAAADAHRSPLDLKRLAGREPRRRPGRLPATGRDACLVAEFDCCPAHPVPDPGRPVRRDPDPRLPPGSWSRSGWPCGPGTARRAAAAPYHGLRVLLGLDHPHRDDRIGRKAAAARTEFASAAPAGAARGLLPPSACLAARDATDRRRPAWREPTSRGLSGAGGRWPWSSPASRSTSGTATAAHDPGVRLDDCSGATCTRCQELLCALAAWSLDRRGPEPHGGRHGDDHDRTARRTGEPAGDPATRFAGTTTTGKLLRCQQAAGRPRCPAVTVTSLSERGWIDDDVEPVRYEQPGSGSSTGCPRSPEPLVRLMVKGTGPTPVYGVEPAAPLAGVLGGPRGGRHDGHDAVVTVIDGPGRREGS